MGGLALSLSALSSPAARRTWTAATWTAQGWRPPGTRPAGAPGRPSGRPPRRRAGGCGSVCVRVKKGSRRGIQRQGGGVLCPSTARGRLAAPTPCHPRAARRTRASPIRGVGVGRQGRGREWARPTPAAERKWRKSESARRRESLSLSLPRAHLLVGAGTVEGGDRPVQEGHVHGLAEIQQDGGGAAIGWGGGHGVWTRKKKEK